MKKTQSTIKKGDKLILRIESLIFGGEGLARYKGFIIFIPYVVPGDEVEVEISEVKKTFARARLLSVKSPSADRIESVCPYFYEDKLTSPESGMCCGGCDWLHIAYKKQLQQKTYLVKEAINYIGKLKNVDVRDIISSHNTIGYRNKVQQPVREFINVDGKKEIVTGFYAPGTHKIIPVTNCYMQPEIVTKIITFTRELLNEYDITPYDEETRRGVVRHLVVRMGFRTNQVMLIIVTNQKQLPFQKEIVDALKSEFPQLVSIVQNINKDDTNVVLGDYWQVYHGKKVIRENANGMVFDISPGSFFQINTSQAEVVCDIIEEFLQGSCGLPVKTAVDVYAGTGMLTLFLSKFADKVYGIEIEPLAVKDALRNAELNKIENCEFRIGDADLVLRRMYKQKVKPDIIILDPPRKGCNKRVLEAVSQLNPGHIIYVSCDPTTLARDLHTLKKSGYKTCEIQPVDMFPQTYHIECVARLKRRTSEQKNN